MVVVGFLAVSFVELHEVGVPEDVALSPRTPLVTTYSPSYDRRTGVLDQPGCRASRRIEITSVVELALLGTRAL